MYRRPETSGQVQTGLTAGSQVRVVLHTQVNNVSAATNVCVTGLSCTHLVTQGSEVDGLDGDAHLTRRHVLQLVPLLDGYALAKVCKRDFALADGVALEQVLVEQLHEEPLAGGVLELELEGLVPHRRQRLLRSVLPCQRANQSEKIKGRWTDRWKEDSPRNEQTFTTRVRWRILPSRSSTYGSLVPVI